MRRDIRKLLLALLAAVWLFQIPAAGATTSGSKNSSGNRLFAQGKYEDAEKAYLEAQAGSPGRPELTYNLGNTLIKQKKYDQGVQWLRQSLARGNQGLQINGWYNIGNALYEAGNFKDSIQAYIQALRLHPSDNEAKHNLELALRKMREQEEQKQDQGQGQNRQKPETSNQNEGQPKNDPKQPDKKGQQPQPQFPESGGQKPANPQPSQGGRPQGGFSKERALQILDALQNQELADQRRLLERRQRSKASGRDW